MPMMDLEHYPELSDAVRETARLLADGLSDEAIAAELGIGLAALRARLSRLYNVIGHSGRPAVVWAALHRDCCLAEKSS